LSNSCKNELRQKVQCVINSASISDEANDFVANAFSVNRTSGDIESYLTVDDLPVLEFSDIPNGHIAFLEDRNIPVIASNCDWLGIDGRVFGKEIITELWSWGFGGYLGDGTTVSKCSPVREITSSVDWCQVSAGNIHTSAIKYTGEIWSWGSGAFGIRGDGLSTDKCSPVREITSSTDWCQVSGGIWHTNAVKATGEIWSWGRNTGRLGDGTTVNKCSPVREISSSTNWCQVSAGDGHASAVKTTGEIWSWGSVGLGDGTTVSKCSPVREISSSTNWCQVGAGSGFSSALKTTGEIWSWGCGAYGRLGNGATTNRCSPVQEISYSTNWCQVSAGLRHTSAIKTTGEIWSWGNNTCGALGDGRLGDGTTVDKCSPVREISSSTDWCQLGSGSYHTSALKTTGEIWSWGAGSSGRLGNGATTNRCSPVREISSSTDWCQVSGGTRHSSAIKLKSITFCG
jgi:alpha-tubulin suppressor-like RCC1 family protein